MGPTICVSSTKEGKTQMGCVIDVGQIAWKWARINNVPLNGSPYNVPNFDKMIMKSHIMKLRKNTMKMGVRRIIKQMGKVETKNWTKTVTFEKWLTMTLN